MGTERRRLMVLGALVVLLSVVLYRAWTATSGPSVVASDRSPAAPRSTRAGAPPPSRTAPEVHLESLGSARPKPGEAERNLFRFKARPQPLPPAQVAPAPTQLVPSVPTGPPPPPPIPLKFIGIIGRSQESARIAALVDAAGHAYHGAEGDIIAGQYRVLKIGVESIEMAYLDGRGRQTIRLSGS